MLTELEERKAVELLLRYISATLCGLGKLPLSEREEPYVLLLTRIVRTGENVALRVRDILSDVCRERMSQNNGFETYKECVTYLYASRLSLDLATVFSLNAKV